MCDGNGPPCSACFGYEPVPYRGQNRSRHDQQCAVYRAYDAQGRLLYVGHSTAPRQRMYQHRSRRAPWVSHIARVDEQWFDDVDSALDEESSAIRRELPIYNVAGARSKTLREPEPWRLNRLPTQREAEALAASAFTVRRS